MYRVLRSNDEWTAALPIVWESRDHGHDRFCDLIGTWNFQEVHGSLADFGQEYGLVPRDSPGGAKSWKILHGWFFLSQPPLLACLHTLFAMILRRKNTCINSPKLHPISPAFLKCPRTCLIHLGTADSFTPRLEVLNRNIIQVPFGRLTGLGGCGVYHYIVGQNKIVYTVCIYIYTQYIYIYSIYIYTVCIYIYIYTHTHPHTHENI